MSTLADEVKAAIVQLNNEIGKEKALEFVRGCGIHHIRLSRLTEVETAARAIALSYPHLATWKKVGVPLQGHSDVVISGDTSTCNMCGQTWDTNDSDPPKCVSPAARFVSMRQVLGAPYKMPGTAELLGTDIYETAAHRIFGNQIPPLPAARFVGMSPALGAPYTSGGFTDAGLAEGEVAARVTDPYLTAFDSLNPESAFRSPTRLPDAPSILDAAAGHLRDRAAARDQPDGERSMSRCVTAYNAITGHALSERDGWLFMVVLKATRACNTPTGLDDDYEDTAAYAALAGEAAAKER